MKISKVLLIFLFSTIASAQNLTISATGETGASGNNWSISGNVITISGTANIAGSVIENRLASNSLSIQGNTSLFAVNVNQSISSSASGNGLTIGAASNTGNIALNSAISLAGSVTIIGGRVSIMDSFSLSSTSNLSITSINTVIAGTTTIGGSASVSASGNFILGTNINAGTGFPLTASGGFTKTGVGTSYLFSNINTTNTAVTIAGPVVVGNFNTSNAITQINTNGGNISIPGAVSAYSGTGREYMALVYANLYDATGGAVTGSTTDIYLRFNAGNQSFVGLPGMPASFNLQYLLVAGGGGGGGSNVGVNTGGGGGGGGAAEGNLTYNTGNTLSMVIGAGGTGGGGNCCINGINGGDTGFNELGLWVGGGGGAGNAGQSAGNTGTGNNNLAVTGRSYLAGGGGGGSGRNNFVYPSGGTGTSYPQAGSGTQTSFGNWGPWGGGGGGAVSGGYFFGDLGYGGAGRSSSITGTSVLYGSGSGPRDRNTNIGSGGSSNTSDAAIVNGTNGAILLRFALSSTLDAAILSTAFHLNAIAGSVTLGSTVANLSNIEITAGIASSITGPISGTGSLLKTGAGALTLSGDNRYSGGTTVTTGTLVLNDTAPMDGMGVVVGTLNINQNGTVQLTGLVSALGYNANRVTTININGGVLEAVGGVQHIWNLTGGLNFNGGGTLKSNGGNSNAAATSYFEWGVTNITITNPTSPAEIAGRIHLRNDNGTSTFTVADGAADNDLLISAAITQSNSSGLTKSGAGKLTFTGNNSYAGTTTISAGTLQIGNGSTSGTISSGAVTNNSALVFNRSDDFTISNVISGTGTVTKTGAGIVTISGANTYSGLTTISEGTLKCGSTSALGTIAGSTTIVDGAALDLGGFTLATAEPITINGTGVSASGVIYNSTVTAVTLPSPITLASNATINGTAGNLTLSGAINGAFALNVNSTNKTYTQSGLIGGTTPPTAFTVAVGNTGSATISGATTVAGPVSISGGTLAINANLTATANNVTLNAVTTVTQTAPIIANGLDLNGAGTFTLTNTTNNIATLSGGSALSKLGSVNYMDSDGFTIGTVTNTGITTSGTITAETQLGNITIAQNITTDNATTSAITINAGKPRSIGDAIGGNVIISGSPLITTGTNGITKLFSGRETESTGLTSFVGGTPNVRLGVDETTATFAPVLANNNKYALYRYSDLILGGITIVNSGGATVNNGWEFVNNTIIPTSAAAINIDASVLQNYLLTNPLTVKAGSITFSANIANSTANQLTLNSNTFIRNTTATSITTTGGNVLMASNVDDATDNDTTTNGYIQFSSGLTMTTNGGNITLGGGDAAASGYALGNNVSGSYEGIRVDGTLNLNSGGGNIVMRGKSYAVNSTAARWALGFWALTTGSINSGTGTILLDGLSQSSGSVYSSALYNNGALTITSANTTTDAIRMIGKATGTTGDAWGIEAYSALSVLATGDGGGITISTSQQVADNYDAVFRGETNILAKSGPIQLLGKQDGGVANGRWFVGTNFYLGSKAGSTVTTSSSNITIQYDKYNFTIYPYIATSGLIAWKPGSASFGQDVFTSWFNWNQNSQTMSGLTIGKIGNTANVTHQTTAVTVAGPLTIYGGDITVSHNFTSTLSGADILLQATGAINLASSKTIQTSAGDVTLSATSGGTATSSSSAIYLNSYSQILSNGGNITLGGGYSGTEGNLYAATTISGGGYAVRMDGGTILNANGGNINIYGRNVSRYGDGVYFSSVNISTLGSGTIGIYGDSYGGFNGTTYFGGVTFENNASTIQNVNGSITLKGILTESQHAEGYAINFYRSAGVTGQTKHIQIVSQTGAIQITGDRGTSIGRGFGHSSWGNIYFGSPSDNSFTATGAIKFTYSSLVIATNNGFKVKTTGPVTYEPAAASFITSQTLPTNAFSTLADGASSLTIGKSGNTADITMGTAQTVAGPISIYAGTITLNSDLTTTNNGAISLYSDNAIGGLSAQRNITAAGFLNYIPQSNSFAAAVTYPITNLNVSSTGLLIGKQTNTSNVTFGNATSINGPITAYGGAITVSSAVAAAGNILLDGDTGNFLTQNTKGVTINAAITTSNNGNITILGKGGSGTGYNLNHGIDIANKVEAGGTGTINLVGYGGLSFNGTGSSCHGINLDGANAWVKSNGGDITINGFGGGASTGTYSQGFPMQNSSKVSTAGAGTISITGTGGVNTTVGLRGIIISSGSSIFNTGGAINLTGTAGTNGSDNSDGVTLDNANIGSNTSGIITIVGTAGGGTGSDAISMSNTNTIGGASHVNNIVLRGNNMALTGSNSVLSTGQVTIEPYSNSFTSALTFPITNLSIANTITGLTIGKPTNTANITFGNATNITGPITAYGGTITLNANLTTTNNGAISLYTDNPLGGLSTARTLTAAGAFKYIPRTTTFSADVTYPIANLTATSSGLTIGKLTNDKNITINQDVTGGAGIELYGNNLNINSNLKTTSGGAMYLDGNTTIAAGKYIESDGDFTHDGNMTFKSSATGTAAFGKLGGTFISLSGTATVERYIPARRAFRLLSPSVTTSTTIRENWQENGRTDVGLGTHITGNGGLTNGFDVTASNNPSLFTHNQTTGAWQAITNTNLTTLTAGAAYRLMVRGDRTTDMSTNNPTETPTVLRATGALFTGDFDPIINQLAEGYSFVGNPYQAPIDIKAALDASSNMNTDVVYYWDPTLNARGQYVTRDLSTNNNNVSSSFNQYLQPWQAVFVKKSNTSNEASMPLTENHKTVVNASAGVFRNASTIETGKIRVNLLASVNNQWKPTDGALALFNSSYSWNTTSEDHNKFANLDEEVSFLMNDKSIAIAKLNNPNATDEIPIKLNNLRHTNYQWQFELANYNGATPYLLDTQTNTYVTIVNNTTIPFVANGSQNRFKIVFQNEALSTPEFSNQMVLYPNPGKSDSGFNLMGITNAKVSLYNLVGQKLPVETSVVGSNTHVKPSIALSHGVYLVNITQDGKTAQVKWIVE